MKDYSLLLEDILRNYIPSLQYDGGEELKALCPFHADTKPSFSLNIVSGKWNCFGCGMGGKIEKLVEALTGDYIYATVVCKDIAFDLTKKATTEDITILPENNGNSKYLLSRGFKQDVLDFFSVFCNLRKGIIIPIHNEKEDLVGWVERRLFNGEGTYKYSKGLQRKELLYNLDKVLKFNTTEVFVCEGTLDAIWIHQCGFPNVIATLGAGVTKEQIDLLNKWFETTIIVGDNDKAGKKMFTTIKEGCKFANVLPAIPEKKGTDIQDYTEEEVYKFLGGIHA